MACNPKASRRNALRSLLGIVVLLGTVSCAKAPPEATPREDRIGGTTPRNIIIFDIDTLRADHLGCYGYRRDTSPNLDAFAAEAVRFEWAFAQAPNTPPSQASILTGMYPTSHGRIGNEQKIPDSIETMAEVLRASGYSTAAFVDGGLMVRGFGMEQGFDLYEDEGGHLKSIGPRAKDWINGYLDDPSRGDTPFFLLVHTYDVHSPYELSPEPYRSTFLEEIEAPPAAYRNDMSKFMADIWNRRQESPQPSLNQNELDWAIALYDGGIRHVDSWFAGFLEFLSTKDLLDSSIVIVISDHGDEFQEHGSLFHDKLYSSVTRVPFLIRFPGGEHAGDLGSAVETIDLAPTVLDALGIAAPSRMQGESLMPAVMGQGQIDGSAISESPYYGRRMALTNSNYRLFLTAKTGAVELYDYRNDLSESTNLASNRNDVVDNLRLAITEWERQVIEAKSPDEEGEGFSEKATEQLKALGYVQ